MKFTVLYYKFNISSKSRFPFISDHLTIFPLPIPLLMPFYRTTQSKEQLCQYLNRRKSTSQNQGTTTNDFFVRAKCDSRNQFRKSKRFNTTQAEECDIDFRITTTFQPTLNYTFTGECFKKKFKSRGSLKAVDLTHNQQDKGQSLFAREKFYTQNDSTVPIELQNLDIQPIQSRESSKRMAVSLLMSKTQSPTHSPQNIIKTKSSLKYQFKHPTPVKQAQFLIKIKQFFLKKHNLIPKIKSNNLIKIQDYLTQQKDSFKRKMESQLIRIGEAKLISQIREQKGKVYLSGLHGVKKKRKQVENIDKLLVKSRESFSTPNKLISHLKLASEKKQKLENIKNINQAKLENCLEKIKNLNLLHREFVSGKG